MNEPELEAHSLGLEDAIYEHYPRAPRGSPQMPTYGGLASLGIPENYYVLYHLCQSWHGDTVGCAELFEVYACCKLYKRDRTKEALYWQLDYLIVVGFPSILVAVGDGLSPRRSWLPLDALPQYLLAERIAMELCHFHTRPLLANGFRRVGTG